MNKREAKRYVCANLAAEVIHHIANGSEWTYIEREFISGGEHVIEGFGEADCERIREAIREVAAEVGT